MSKSRLDPCLHGTYSLERGTNIHLKITSTNAKSQFWQMPEGELSKQCPQAGTWTQHLGYKLNRKSTGKSILGEGTASAKALWQKEFGDSQD